MWWKQRQGLHRCVYASNLSLLLANMTCRNQIEEYLYGTGTASTLGPLLGPMIYP